MKTAVDSSVLLTIFNGEPAGRSWLKCLVDARRKGPFVICDVVYAELAPAFGSENDFEDTLEKLGLCSRPLCPKRAGKPDTPSDCTEQRVGPEST